MFAGWAPDVCRSLQLALGIAVDVLRRALFGSEPVSALMTAMGALALAANLVCLAPLAKHRAGEVHMRASWIFSVNDVLANHNEGVTRRGRPRRDRVRQRHQGFPQTDGNTEHPATSALPQSELHHPDRTNRKLFDGQLLRLEKPALPDFGGTYDSHGNKRLG